jgi:hypothetical protein
VSARAIAKAAAVLAVGYAITLGLFWALLNVPESSVPALALSAALALLVAVAAGLTTASAATLVAGAAFSPPASREIGRRALRALPGFLAGLMIFAALWWITGSADDWWRAHRGEVDALFLRYLGTGRTALVHEGVSQTTWLVRWALGLSAVAGLVAAGTIGGTRAAARGLRAAVRIVPLLVTAIAALVVGKGLSRLVYWRPKAIPPNWIEAAFVAIKLSVLYLLAIVMAAIVLAAFQRAISRHAFPARS